MGEELKRIGLRGVFEVDEYIAAEKRYSQATQRAQKITMDAARTMQSDILTMVKSGIGVETIARSFNITADEVRAYATAAHEAAEASKKATKAAKNATEIADRQAAATRRLVKRIALWAIGIRTVFTGYNRLRRALIAFIKDVAKGTDQAERLEAAQTRLKESLVGAFGPEALSLVDKFARAIDRIAVAYERWSVQMEINRNIMEAARETGDRHAQMLIAQGVSAEAVAQSHANLTSAILTEDEALARVRRRVEEYRQRQEEIEEESKLERAIEGIIDAAQRFDSEMGRHIARIQEINDEYRVAQLHIRADLFRQMEAIDKSELDKIADINQDALDAREKALDKFRKRIEAAEKTDRRRQINDAERHALQMEFMRRRHRLNVFQSERRFQAARSRLVAEGDVLAIEELEERNAIEKAEREENFRLQRDQAEAMFRLQARIFEESNRRQMAELRKALGDQLALIEKRRQDRVAETREGAQEERAEAMQSAAERLSDARATQITELQQERQAHQERIDQLGDFLRDFANKNEFSLDQVVAIWQSRYGVGGPIDSAIQNAFERYQGYVDAFSASVQRALSGGMMGRRSRFGAPAVSRDTGEPLRHFPEGFQLGGSMTVDRPSRVTVGEGGRRERVSVQPDTLSGGTVITHRWQGGAIPINVAGNDGGANLAGAGELMVQGFIAEMTKQTAKLTGQRGR